jgi:hypothetical protein
LKRYVAGEVGAEEVGEQENDMFSYVSANYLINQLLLAGFVLFAEVKFID